MRNDIKAIADRLIPKPAKVELIRGEYDTTDIISVVLSQFEKHKDQLQKFAPYLKGSTVLETCRNTWQFWLSDKQFKGVNILYAADKAGRKHQFVKSPAAVWADKFADCKSLSVAVMATLHALGIKAVFRFVSFNDETKIIPTHVYVVAKDGVNEIPIDCCIQNFNMELPNAAKYDYLPKGLYAINGIPAGVMKGSKPRPPYKPANPHKQRGCFCVQGVETEAELELMIRKQQLELEQMNASKNHGIGSVEDNAYEIELAAINNAICAIANPRLKRFYKFRSLKPATQFIGCPEQREAFIGKKKDSTKKVAKKAKKEEKKTAKAVKKNTAGKGINKKDAKRLEKINVTVNKKKEGILKKIAKVVTAPIRLLAKGVLELTLPKSAPVFLYLFLNDEKILAKAPSAVKAKRDRAVKIADTIVSKIGMKRDHFMNILRNGITSQLGNSPEGVIAQWIKDANFQIGLLPIFATAGKFLIDLVGKVGGQKISDLQSTAPDPSDWITESSEVREQLAVEVLHQDTANPGGSIPIRTEDQLYNQANNGGFNYGTNTYSGGGTGYNPNYQVDNSGQNKEDFGTGEFGEKNFEGEENEEAVVYAVKKKAEAEGNISTGLFILAGAALLMLAGKPTGRRKRA